MESNFSPVSELPERLQELDALTQAVVERASYIQSDINVTTADYDTKATLLSKAVNDLDRLADGVYLGFPVQIEGNYEYPHGYIDGRRHVLEQREEYGIRRGKSLGFYSDLKPVITEDSEDQPETYTAQLFHGMVMGDMFLHNRLFSLDGPMIINAPIEQSSIVLAAIDDYRKMVFADLFVRQNRRDSRWTDSIDEAICDAQGPDLRALGTRLNRLKSMRPERVEEYLSYINTKLNSQVYGVELLCDTMLVYEPSGSSPAMMRPEDVITGHSPDICFADAYVIDASRNAAFRADKTTPTLSLRTFLDGKSGEHILHIPLSGIQCVDYK